MDFHLDISMLKALLMLLQRKTNLKYQVQSTAEELNSFLTKDQT